MKGEIHQFQKITMGWSCSLNRQYQNNKKLIENSTKKELWEDHG